MVTKSFPVYFSSTIWGCFEKSENLLHTVSIFEMPTINNSFAFYNTQLADWVSWEKKG